MERQKLVHLLHKLQDKSITAAELRILKEYLDKANIEDVLFEDFDLEANRNSHPEKYDVLFQRIQEDSRIASLHNSNKRRYLRNIAAVAASVLILCGTLYWTFSTRNSTPAPYALEEVIPGGNKAQIVLSDGKILDLETLKNDTLVQLAGYAIYKDAHGQVMYRLSHSSSEEKMMYNTIITPKGGEYKLLLPDGTRIAVNAMSSLRYPIKFNADKREVELLSGEAYFEVNKVNHDQQRIPFIVKTKGEILTVLGTVFNINSYSDKTITTLVEGSIQLENEQSKVLLRPTDQAIYSTRESQYTIRTVDPYYLTAWTGGKFAYEKASIDQVMEDIARWYDVHIHYDSPMQGTYFSGTISRFENIDKLLHTISLTGSVKFIREGRRVVVTK